MAKKTAKKVEVIEATALPVPVQPVKKELVLEGDPEAQLAFASKAANALMSIVSKKPNPVMIRGKQYLEYGDWQVLGRFYGATVEIEWSHPLLSDEGKIVGYEARALVKRNGEMISSAEGMCLREEKRWKDADEYAVRSMAQTRTAAKALRNAFGWVAELAGYSATPAEEMPRDDAPKMTPYSAPRVAPVDPAKKIIKHYLVSIGFSLSTKEEYEAKVKELTNLDLIEDNYQKIIEILRNKIEESDPLATFDRVVDEKDN